MTQTLFQTGVDEFIQKHIVHGRVTTKEEFNEVRRLGKEAEAELFEQLLLFDRVAFKVI